MEQMANFVCARNDNSRDRIRDITEKELGRRPNDDFVTAVENICISIYNATEGGVTFEMVLAVVHEYNSRLSACFLARIPKARDMARAHVALVFPRHTGDYGYHDNGCPYSTKECMSYVDAYGYEHPITERGDALMDAMLEYRETTGHVGGVAFEAGMVEITGGSKEWKVTILGPSPEPVAAH